MNLEKQLLNFMKKKNYIPLTKEELAVALNISFNNLKQFFKLLDSLVNNRKILLIDYKYSIYQKKEILKGKISFTTKGNAFFISEDDIDDVFIPKKELNHANHNDDVEIEIIKEKGINSKAEGRVLKVLNRNSNLIVGTFTENKNFGFVVPDDIKCNYDIFIKKGDKNGAKTDDKVVCKLVEFPDKKKNPEGVVIEVIGNKKDKNAQIISLLKDMEIKKWVIDSFFFPYKNKNYIVILKLYRENEKRPSKYAKATVEFIKQENVNVSIKGYIDFYNVHFDSAYEFCEFFGVEKGNANRDLFEDFSAIFSRYIPSEKVIVKSSEERLLIGRRTEGNNPNAIYCFDVRRNGKKEDGTPNGRSVENSNKAEILRPDLYKRYFSDTNLSFFFSDDPTEERTDREIIESFAKRK